MISFLLFILLGLVVGGFGTLIGAGGGFLLTPLLLVFYPSMPTQTVTAISMFAVLFNSSSGSLAYAYMKRIDYKTGIIFAIATSPGSIIGTFLTQMIDRNLFDTIFGVFMLVFAFIIAFKSKSGDKSNHIKKNGFCNVVRELKDREGNKVKFSFNMLAGILISIGVGFISGLLGIGGGIVHVPALVFLGFPAHFATATSHFVLAFSSLSSVIVHLNDGSLNNYFPMAICIAIGTIVGAQIGARLSKRIKGSVIMLCLSAALALVSLRILFMGISGMFF
ncbi:MAG: sulfite exporter TauE/SafE family protein [Bacillota bacterium]|nr:sulfite exporter TauE/SafE family protein [Bacillota bacterium]